MDSRDVKKLEIPKVDNYFAEILLLQTKLMEEYKEIEKWDVNWPLDLNLKSSQLLIKDMIARAVEELAEAFESLLEGNTGNYYEELADATHFIFETLILADLPVESIYKNIGILYDKSIKSESKVKIKGKDPLKDMFILVSNPLTGPEITTWLWRVTFHLNLARNALRNKPWKQTEIMYNPEVFGDELSKALIQFFVGFVSHPNSGIEKFFGDYYRKHRINLFRIKSKY